MLFCHPAIVSGSCGSLMLDLHHRGDRTDQERAYCTDSGLYDRVV